MSNEYKDWRREQNLELVQKFPFLLPRNRFTGEVVKDYDYEYTELDDMDDGWRYAFGEQMCQEIKDALVEEGCLDQYRIMQIKEKFGGLRWYDNGAPKKVDEIIAKYSALSEKTCVRCGEPATKESAGWISPYCNKCADELEKKGIRFVKLGEGML